MGPENRDIRPTSIKCGGAVLAKRAIEIGAVRALASPESFSRGRQTGVCYEGARRSYCPPEDVGATPSSCACS